ncbi:MAG: DUF1573 domain-containing protein [Vampirovibrionales bacterium]|nr:DUF1573 domain-containing protein [Vampirovibrionales bacterium]
MLHQAAKWMVGLWVLALLPLLCASAFLKPQLRPVLINPYAPPTLLAEPWVQTLGDVKTDAKAATEYRLRNIGGKPLKIYSAEPSCGCTVAKLSKDTILPGQFATLKINLDTSIKLGHVEKTIALFSNDPDPEHQELKLVANVLPNFKGHKPVAVKNPLVLFQGQCATCHVQKGIGKSGEALFNADCAMCHGIGGSGRVAPALIANTKGVLPLLPDNRYHDATFLKNLNLIISNGSPTSPTMPPFSQHKGGPLTDSQIESLVTYLKFLALNPSENPAAKQASPKNTP